MTISKATRSLQDIAGETSRELGFLVLSGSFNPIHLGHLRLLDAARAKYSNDKVKIMAGFLAPSSDNYVVAKLGGQAWSLDLRTRLCVLATIESDWIDVWDTGQMSGYRVCAEVCEQLREDSADLLAGRSLTGIEVMGSDTAIRILDKLADDWEAGCASQPWYEGRRVCCLLRPGVTGYDDAVHLESRTSPRVAPIGVDLSIVDPRAEGFMLESVSGTEIRQFMAQNDWSSLRVRNWLHPRVLNALQASRIPRGE